MARKSVSLLLNITMLPFRPSEIIRDPSRGKQSERKIMDGVIHSGVLDTFQVGAVEGLVHSGIPKRVEEEKPQKMKMVDSSSKKLKKKGDPKPMEHPSKKPATPYSAGFVKFPGSSYA